MRVVFLALVLLGSFQAQALQFIKCGSVEGKTLYGTFGRRVTSGANGGVVYYPIEFVVFSSPQTLQDRIFYRTKDALKLPLEVADTGLAFSFEAKAADGVSVVTESFQLSLISPKDLTGMKGSWITLSATGEKMQSVFTMCSVF